MRADLTISTRAQSQLASVVAAQGGGGGAVDGRDRARGAGPHLCGVGLPHGALG